MNKERAMARRGGVNKSQAIRDALAANPDKSPSEIAEVLKSQGVKVTGTYVSNIKSTAKTARKARRAGRRAGPAMGRTSAIGFEVRNGIVAQNPIVAALNLVRSAGSLEAARQALGTVEEIGKAVR
jgi:hypothetical protein